MSVGCNRCDLTDKSVWIEVESFSRSNIVRSRPRLQGYTEEVGDLLTRYAEEYSASIAIDDIVDVSGTYTSAHFEHAPNAQMKEVADVCSDHTVLQSGLYLPISGEKKAILKGRGFRMR